MSAPPEPVASPWRTVLAGLALVVVVAATLAGPFLIVVVNRAARYVVGLVPGSIGDALPSYLVNTALDWGLAQAALLLASAAVARRLGHRLGHRLGGRRARRPAARPAIGRTTCGSAERPAIAQFVIVPVEPRPTPPSRPARQLERTP